MKARQPRQDRPRKASGGLGGAKGAEGATSPLRGPQGAITFRVSGMDPAPQGSKRHVGGGRMVESCRTVKPWRELVARSAMAAGVPRLAGPVRMSAVFLLQRPANHYRHGVLKPLNPALVSATTREAPQLHAVRPDASKLQRSTEDALTGLSYDDDARIVGCSCEKRWCVEGEAPGALITLIPLS